LSIKLATVNPYNSCSHLLQCFKKFKCSDGWTMQRTFTMIKYCFDAECKIRQCLLQSRADLFNCNLHRSNARASRMESAARFIFQVEVELSDLDVSK